MAQRKMVWALAMAGILLAGLSVSAFAQDAGGGNGGGGRGGRGGGRGNFDPTQMRQRMMDNLKEQLGAADDEWKVIQPKLEQVMTARRDTGGGGGFGGRGMRGPGGGMGGAAPGGNESAVAAASRELRAALQNKDTPATEIAKKLATFREARDKARESLVKSQKELKELLTQRQEAVLVTMGMLD